ncbi:MAG: 7-carboxy-7-deazaguanine synthase [Polyangiaceae bacterium]
MSYAVKETFYTLQGEGAHAGRAAVFLRFTGCNLWSGREADREKGPGGCSRWCDTDFAGTDGAGGGRFSSAHDLARHVASHWLPRRRDRRFVVCTGGEPLLQLDEPLTAALHDQGFEIAVETNGTLPLPPGIDWVCVSPKQGGELVVRAGHELKLVVPQPGLDPADFASLDFQHFLLQPMDGLARAESTRLAVEYCLAHPEWRVSLQTHKLLGIP